MAPAPTCASRSNFARAVRYTRKAKNPLERTDPAPLLSEDEAAEVAPHLARALAAAGPSDRVRILLRHAASRQGGAMAGRVTVLDAFVKDDALHLLFQELLSSREAAQDTLGVTHLYPELHAGEGQETREEPGPRRGEGVRGPPGRASPAAPRRNWLVIPLVQGDPDGEAAGGSDGAVAARLRLAQELGVLTLKEYEERIRALERRAVARAEED